MVGQRRLTTHGEKHSYNTVNGQPSRISRTLEGTVYDFDFTSDGQGRLDVMSYPDIAGYRFNFDAAGNLVVAKHGNTSAVFYALSQTDALGRERYVTFGNGLDEQRTFDRASGHLVGVDTGFSSGSTIQDLTFTYDDVGNLATRDNALIGKTEMLVYDALDRLDTAQVSGGSVLNDVTKATRAGSSSRPASATTRTRAAAAATARARLRTRTGRPSATTATAG